MSRDLCDETFPTSLLIEFDQLDDEIPISPELPKRQSVPARFTTHRSTRTGMTSAKGHDDRNGSRTVVSGSSNTSSGHSSLSTEGGNGSASSERDTSRDLCKRPKAAPDVKVGSRKLRPPRSMESLLPSQPARSTGGTGLALPDVAVRSGSTGNVSSAAGVGGSSSSISIGHSQTSLYSRHRAKYGHVQSKVKQLIDEMKPATTKRDRSAMLVRHKSMPETSYDSDSRAEEEDNVLEHETDVVALRAIVREMKLHTSSLEQQLNVRDLYHTNVFNELAVLKCKNSALRMENDHLLEQERAREQRRQLLRQCEQHNTPGSCYGSQSSLYKASSTNCVTVGIQTSPPGEDDDDGHRFNFIPVSPASSTVIEPTVSTVGEFLPEYEQLLPPHRHDGILRPDCRHRAVCTPATTSGPTHDVVPFSPASATSCRDCRRRKKKRKSRRQKLASFFCIRHHDESV